MRVCILTGSELRHTFVRMAIAADPEIDVPLSVCEGNEQSLLHATSAVTSDSGDIRLQHLRAREISEEDFFRPFVTYTQDWSNPAWIPKGSVNEEEIVARIEACNADVLLCYGSSLIKSRLLETFANRFLNVHLGLSPWYRGSGTNFWALANGEPEFFGATFMYIDKGVDTGTIIHQIRPQVYQGDTPHQLGNRLIAEIPGVYLQIAKGLESLVEMTQPPKSESDKVFRRRDFSPNSVRDLYRRFDANMIGEYLENRSTRNKRAPILQNPSILDP